MAYQDDGHLEKAMRTWASHDTRAKTSIAQIDQRRLEYLQNLFVQMGFSMIEAKARARLTYYSWIGEFTVGIPSTLEERLTEAQLNHSILTQLLMVYR